MSRVLIADDNVGMTLSCSNFLTKEKNIEIVGIVNNGIDALKCYNEEQPDVLLLDLDMPEMSGLEVIEELSKDETEIRKNNIIVISGTLDRLHPYNTAQVYRIMPKPLDYDKLLETIYEIQENLDDYRLEKEIKTMFLELNLTDTSLKGLDYLKKVVFYCYKYPEMRTHITLAYEQVIRYYSLNKKKPKNIMWNLESMLKIYEKNISKDFLQSYFYKYDFTRNLSPTYLVDLMVSHLDEKLEKKMVEV